MISLLPSPSEVNKDGGAHEQATRRCQSLERTEFYAFSQSWYIVQGKKPMSDMLMDYVVITSGDEYSDIESENSDDHAISSDESKSNPRARPHSVDGALSRPTTSTGIVKHARLGPPTDTVLPNGGSAQGGPGHQDQDIRNGSVVTMATRPCGEIIL